MKTQNRLLSVLVVLAAITPALGAQAVKVTEEKPGLLLKAKITADSAIALAKVKMPKATLQKAEIEEEDGKLIYTLIFKTAGKKGVDELNVDAMTGKVAKPEHESDEDEAKEAKAEKAKPAKPTKKP